MTKGHTAVMAAKRPALKEPAPWQALEFFPTPPWATRALVHRVFPNLRDLPAGGSAWEPCAGLGHMSDVLVEAFDRVRASDVFLYPFEGPARPAIRHWIERFDFLDEAAVAAAEPVDWIITNPPFTKAARMLGLALAKARIGVAFLMRMQWLEGAQRYAEVFARRGPTVIAPFVERVPMCEGGWDPDGSTATMYAWFVWRRCAGDWQHASGDWLHSAPDSLVVDLIPPGAAEKFTNPLIDRGFALRHVPGWIAPSKLKKVGRGQGEMFA